MPQKALPLSGLKVLEIGHYIAAPFATRLLADLGAEVVKVEPPEGDPVRGWGSQKDGHTVWFSVHGRNKLSVTLNLKSAEDKARLLRLARRADALVENFRPGQLERLGLGPDALHEANPRLVIARISGFDSSGQLARMAKPAMTLTAEPAEPLGSSPRAPDARSVVSQCGTSTTARAAKSIRIGTSARRYRANT